METSILTSLERAHDDLAQATAEKYVVHLPVWTGPYDLLLQIIQEKELSLLDLNISELLDAYLKHLDSMTLPDVDEAGEFIVVGATLAQIKSKMLLPKEEQPQDEVEEEDPRAELVRYLMEYQKIKKAAEFLREQPLLGRDVFIKGIRESFEGVEGEGHGTLFQLVKGFQKAVLRVDKAKPFEISMEDVSVNERFREIFSILRHTSEVDFGSLLPEGRSKVYLIASFLAVLELIRMKKIRVLQKEMGGNLFLVLNPGATEEDIVDSEFDRVSSEIAPTAEAGEIKELSHGAE